MRVSVLGLCLVALLLPVGSVQAANDAPALAAPRMGPLDVKSYALMDYRTGRILAAKHPHEALPPASTTKLMTAFVVFDAIRAGDLTLDTTFHISRKAWHEGGSRMFVEPGSNVSVSNLLKGILVPSGNDAAMALAQGVSGTEQAFVARMNQAARELGLHDTHYTNPNGLPDDDLHSSAIDLAKLSRAIIQRFPDQYRRFFAVKSFTWNDIRQTNYNKLLFRDPSVDGLKPGYVSAVGYNLAASAKRDGTRLIGVVMGADKPGATSAANYINLANVTGALLDYGFRSFATHKLYDAGQAVFQAKVKDGEKDKVALGLSKTLYVVVPKGQYAQLDASVALPDAITAPVRKGQALGHLEVKLHGKTIARAPLVALQNDKEYSFWSW